MPLLLSALWLTTAGLIYNPLGAWLHDKVNSRRTMYMIGFVGIVITTSILAAMTAEYAGTTNKAGNAIGVLMMFLYLAMQGECSCVRRVSWPLNRSVKVPSVTRLCTCTSRRFSRQRLGRLGWDGRCLGSSHVRSQLSVRGTALTHDYNSNDHPPADSTNWICERGMEVLPGDHLLECVLPALHLFLLARDGSVVA